MLCNETDKKVSSPCDTLVQLVGKIVVAIRTGDIKFSSRLTELRGDGPEQELWFKNKNGLIWMIRRSDISSISELRPRRQ
jgi:hypothetical protein